jgi:hypothetical protein
MKRFVTRALIVMASILGIVFAQVAPASAQASDELASNLATLWTTVLETPRAQNPFAQDFDNKLACWDLGDSTVAPFAGSAGLSCKVKPDTKIFVAGFSFECSTIPGDDGNPELTEEQLRQCARDHDLQVAPTITVDGKSVTVTEVETSALHPVLPKQNVFGAPKGTYLSVAHGWITLLDPLTPGSHEIVIDSTNNPGGTVTTTTINVKRH